MRYPIAQLEESYVVRYPRSATGHTSLAYVMVSVWKIPHGMPQRISAASNVCTSCAVKKIVVNAAIRTRHVITVYR